jgi:uncharacterized protein YkwD
LVSLSIVTGLSMVIVLIVVLKGRDSERAKAPVAVKAASREAPPVFRREEEEAPKSVVARTPARIGEDHKPLEEPPKIIIPEKGSKPTPSVPLKGEPAEPAPNSIQNESPSPEKGSDHAKPAKPTAVEQTFLKKVNYYRKLAGLRHVTLDAELSEGCKAHAKYLIVHDGEPSTKGLSAHDEKPDQDGFTEKGRTAGRVSVIAGSHGSDFPGGPSTAVDIWMASFFHRIPFLNPDLKRIGIGFATNTKGSVWQVVLNARSGVEREGKDQKERTEPIVYPADKQKDVSRTFSLGASEEPNPLPRGVQPLQAGYTITATFSEGTRVEDINASLEWVPERKIPDFVVTTVPVWLSTPEKPAGTFEHQQNTVCLIAKEPLRAFTTYQVTVRAKVNGELKEKTWKFSTAAQ